MIDNAVLDSVAHHAGGALLKPGSNIQLARFLHLFDGYQQVFNLHFGDVTAAVRGEHIKLEVTQHPLLMFRRPVHVTGDPFACTDSNVCSGVIARRSAFRCALGSMPEISSNWASSRMRLACASVKSG